VWGVGGGQKSEGNRQRGTGNGEQATGNRQRGTGNGEQATVDLPYPPCLPIFPSPHLSVSPSFRLPIFPSPHLSVSPSFRLPTPHTPHPTPYSLLPSISYSHSMVPGGLEVISYTTRFTPATSLTMRLEMVSNKS
jgi:hypothetical protein